MSWYEVPLVGGHLTLHEGAPALSAFGIGRADGVLSMTNVAAGQSLIVGACTTGAMRADFPFFPSFDERGAKLAGDVRLFARWPARRRGRREGREHGRAGRVAGHAARAGAGWV